MLENIPTFEDSRSSKLSVALAMVTLVVLSAVVLVSAARPAQAAFPGQNGKIVFNDDVPEESAEYGSISEIFTVDPDGTDRTQITNGGGFEPAISPDGKSIVYGFDGELYTIPATGGTPTRVTNNSTNEQAPSWSADGKKIVFMMEDGTGWNIYTVAATGGTPAKVSINRLDPSLTIFNPRFSPDGSKIAFYAAGQSDEYDIYTVPATGGTPTQLTDDSTSSTEPSFSPDGKTLVYMVYGDIYTIPTIGGTPTYVQGTSSDVKPEGSPVFSPDGTKIAFDAFHRGDFTTGIYEVP